MYLEAMNRLFVLLLVLVFPLSGNAQRVGLVLSGGGATGFAHIGVLKALEENEIPVDYITGTSAGALVGALYASGYSPWEIEAMVTSERFLLMADGEIEDIYKSLIHQPETDAGLISYRFDIDSVVERLLPTRFLNTTALDFELLRLLGTNPQSSIQTFDSLFIPFRCNASDITTKSAVLFDSGNLNEAVRASMTYPFFISPIEVDGKLLFDGGLYNNFPSDIMYNEFDTDFIIGSNVSYNEPEPTRNDLMSQVRNMFSTYSNYSLPCEQGIIIEPDLGDEVGTFEFEKISRAIEIGYETAMQKMDSIKMHISLRVSQAELSNQRRKYQQSKSPVNVSTIQIENLPDDKQNYYVRKLQRKVGVIAYEDLQKRYLHVYQGEEVESLFPLLEPETDSTQRLRLWVNREKPLKLTFGGHYSSRPVNTGFLSLSYSDFRVTPLTIYGNAYFGKFYGSVKAGFKLFLPTRHTTYVEPVFVRNRWDYFKSFATFFEDVKPSFLVHNEMFLSLRFNSPLGPRGKLALDFTYGNNDYRYYQSDAFTNLDTADYTSFLYYTPGITYVMDKLNRKQWESAGSKLVFKTRYVYGIENTRPGSTSTESEETTDFRKWVYFTANYKKYFVSRGPYRLGILAEGTWSFQPFFRNYTSSLLMAHSFQPTPDSQTGFYNDFRSNKYVGVGLINIFTVRDLFDVRLEAYLFQPFYRINLVDGEVVEGSLLEARFGMASASMIYHSPVGPIRATANFIQSQSILDRFSFQISFGYILFNNNALK